MSILQNALNSIIIGVEDFNMDDDRRLLSSTRNIFAGVLLLFKHKLVELSPNGSDEVLIKQKLLPTQNSSGEIVWVGKGAKTVDVQQIKERFKSLDISVDWDRLDKINRYRNNIEHYYSTESIDAIHTLLSNSFLVIRDFITTYLEEDPKELLGEEIWTTLLEINEVYEAEKEDCINKLKELEWRNDWVFDAVLDYGCDDCLSDLITVKEDGKIECKSCGNKYSQEELIEKALIQVYGSYRIQDGEESDLIECPYCQKRTYMISENECQICGEEFETECMRCGMTIPSCELDGSGICGYCSYMAAKRDKED